MKVLLALKEVSLLDQIPRGDLGQFHDEKGMHSIVPILIAKLCFTSNKKHKGAKMFSVQS